MPFTDPTLFTVRRFSDTEWVTVYPLQYRGRTDLFEVPAGFVTDFASTPRVFTPFFPSYGQYTLAAVLHDFLSRNWRTIPTAIPLTPHDVDGIFRRVMRELGVPLLMRSIMWAGVRVGALTDPRRRGWRDWRQDAWKVAGLAVVALPILLLPAVVNTVEYALYRLMEFTVSSATPPTPPTPPTPSGIPATDQILIPGLRPPPPPDPPMSA